MRETVIFDLDDTLADWQAARAQGVRYFDAVATGVMRTREDMLALANEYLANGTEVIALTARPAILREATESWVAEHLGSDVAVVMTSDSTRRKDHETKALLLATLADRNIVAAYDDKPENVAMFTEHGIQAHLV